MSLAARGVLVLAEAAAFALVAVVWRAWLQRRRTGATGVVLMAANATRAERLADCLYGVVVLGLILVPVAALLDIGLGGPSELDADIVAAGVALAVVAIAAAVWSQLAMGGSWRIGVDRGETTDLVTGGPFRLVRNPIYTAMVLFVAAVGLVLPSPVMLVLFVSALVCVEVQVRAIEEPFLAERHGARYAAWAARTGRFVPGIGSWRAR